jgi:hypothetical protein
MTTSIMLPQRDYLQVEIISRKCPHFAWYYMLKLDIEQSKANLNDF